MLSFSDILVVSAMILVAPTHSGEAELKRVMENMSKDTLEFAAAVEDAYSMRCSTDTLESCYSNNYDDCVSVYPGQTCPPGDQLVISSCGDGVECNGLFDTTISTVRVPETLATAPNGNPEDHKIIETVCYSRRAEEWVKQKYQDDEMWTSQGIDPPQMWFGSQDGTFRIFPARHSRTCGAYDPRRRPWYIAASSGPKDVVLVLDTSGSMSNHGRLALSKQAARTIIDTLTVGDRVAVVDFNTDASILGGRHTMQRATKANKDQLKKEINAMEAGGQTNFLEAFKKAFYVLDNTISQEWTSGCNIAILFLTDGQMNRPEGVTETAVVDLIQSRIDKIENQDVYIFTYSLGQESDKVIPKTIACQTGGLWAEVQDTKFGGDLVTSMSNYYRLFALGLGEGDNEDFTAWVEPYHFATAGNLGTTVSAPVYDRTVDPPLFLGSVGMGFLMAAMDKALGEDAGSTTMLDQLILASTAHCPRLNLSVCDLESLRHLGGGQEALCGQSCPSFVGIIPEECSFISDYPTNLWENTGNNDKTYEDRVCCEVGGTGPSDACPAVQIAEKEDNSSSNTDIIAGVVVVIVGSVIVALCCTWWCRRRSITEGSTSDTRKTHVNTVPNKSIGPTETQDYGQQIGYNPNPAGGGSISVVLPPDQNPYHYADCTVISAK